MWKALIKQLRLNTARVLRESGQALYKVGSRLTDDVAYLEKCSRHRNVMPIYELWPSYGKSYIAPNASIVGEVFIGNNCAIWYGAILKGDINAIRINDHVFVGDNTVMNTSENLPTGIPSSINIGSQVYIGPQSTLFACTIDDQVYIGKGSTINEGVRIEKGAMVGAGSVVSPGNFQFSGKIIPSKQLWAGNPAEYVRDLNESDEVNFQHLLAREFEQGQAHCDQYSELGHAHIYSK